ncbi:hemerythrin HHE cation binding domain-containing protein [Desulfosporosinus acidiphilus SJ4]|uniref:Hemerythrin HHE cation binding domain-containing protein n=1 Tax=Desulfosporosinus acidiphilus (strain DSM 22704 / JCM 16185 / SJ4) TaxID=646529 RepID=I4D733_DESAJ|nr:hemerythrin domain-containing protein [Desulfosporosinus acidiphilus]AFM41607.1 hemerythrin HHE cation binding domain-containing protein [Desulfosporosinus acidiphilus SJ4]
MNIDNLTRQHREIAQLIKEIETLLTQDVAAKSFDISLKMAALSGKLSIHLKTEDDYLYPSLKISNDERLKRTANLFNEEMENIAHSFANYKANYISGTQIKKDVTKFINETRSIFSLLKHRLNHEDNQLYPLVQNL